MMAKADFDYGLTSILYHCSIEEGTPDAEEVITILESVRAYRVRFEITPTPKGRIEPSCFEHGEFKNLYVSLATTIDGMGVWGELQHLDIRLGVLKYVRYVQDKYGL